MVTAGSEVDGVGLSIPPPLSAIGGSEENV